MNPVWALLWVLGVSGAVWLAAGGVAWLVDRVRWLADRQQRMIALARYLGQMARGLYWVTLQLNRRGYRSLASRVADVGDAVLDRADAIAARLAREGSHPST